jgi:2,4-dienoyl-CoA reductase-like NADH-dependent reductase (Old Yellow Enzyme family)
MMTQVFSPGQIGRLTLPNRLIHSATYECLAAEDGSVTEALINRYKTLAQGGVGLIIPGYFYVDARGKAMPNQTGIAEDRHLPGLTELVGAVHRAGSLIAFQIAHGGRQAPRKLIGQAPLAPSRFGRDPVSLSKPAAATETDIEQIIRAFAAAARRTVQAGADALQLHCAHGYLLQEFLSPFFNRRRDRWGGSPENRFRLVREIILAIRAEIGADFPILVKMNANDFTPRPGIDPLLAAQYARWLAELDIAALEISSGTYYTFHMVRGEVPLEDMARGLPRWMRLPAKMVFKKQIIPCRFKSLYHLEAAATIKPALGRVPLILVGGVRTLAEMERVLADGQADFLSLSRPFIREPYLAKRLKSGETTGASCISCNKCFAAVFNGLPLRCYVKGLPGPVAGLNVAQTTGRKAKGNQLQLDLPIITGSRSRAAVQPARPAFGGFTGVPAADKRYAPVQPPEIPAAEKRYGPAQPE